MNERQKPFPAKEVEAELRSFLVQLQRVTDQMARHRLALAIVAVDIDPSQKLLTGQVCSVSNAGSSADHGKILEFAYKRVTGKPLATV